MELELVPEPDDAARAAVVAALDARREEDARAVGESAWWRAGVEESVFDEPERR